MKSFFFLMALLAMGSCNNPQESKAPENKPDAQVQISELLNPQDFAELIKSEDVQLIDVRTPEEVALGSIEGSVNINFRSSSFKEDILKLDREKPVLVFCKSGGRSGQAADFLNKNGFLKVYDLEGGYSSWPYK